MDLRNQTITVGELLDDPRSAAVFRRRFGRFLNHPLIPAARKLTLRQLSDLAQGYLPAQVIRDTLQELQRL